MVLTQPTLAQFCGVKVQLEESEKKTPGSYVTNGIYHIPIKSIGLGVAQKHVDALTFIPKGNHDFGQPQPPVVAATIEDNILSVPKYYGIIHFGPPENGNASICTREDMQFSGKLRQGGCQVDAADSILAALKDSTRGGATLVLPCGFGKTVVSLFIASQLSMKTLVLCHKSCLVEQWKERIHQYIPSAKVGIIQGGRAEASDEYAIVIGMLQSVYSHEYPVGTLSGFGTLIVDEAHHVPAATFLTAVSKVETQSTLALTATPDRKDGLTGLLYASMGNVEFKVERPPMEGSVEIRKLPCKPTVREKRLRGADTPVNLSKLITDLASDEKRTNHIVRDILNLLDQTAPERYIIVLSDRTAQLKSIQQQLLESKHSAILADEHGGARLLIGATKAKDRETALKARVVLTTYPFSQEGVDQPRLDTLVTATPKGDTVQAIGRILRQHPDKAQPLILDYTESVESGVLHGLFAKRRRIYNDHGFDIQYASS